MNPMNISSLLLFCVILLHIDEQESYSFFINLKKIGAFQQNSQIESLLTLVNSLMNNIRRDMEEESRKKLNTANVSECKIHYA